MTIITYTNNAETNKINKDMLHRLYVYEVVLKDETILSTPVFLLSMKGDETLYTLYKANYLYCDEFKRYYFIKNIKIVRNTLFEISCEVDVLMSFKEHIAEQNAFLKRCSDSTYQTLDVVDNNVPFTNNYKVETSRASFTNGTSSSRPRLFSPIWGSSSTTKYANRTGYISGCCIAITFFTAATNTNLIRNYNVMGSTSNTAFNSPASLYNSSQFRTQYTYYVYPDSYTSDSLTDFLSGINDLLSQIVSNDTLASYILSIKVLPCVPLCDNVIYFTESFTIPFSDDNYITVNFNNSNITKFVGWGAENIYYDSLTFTINDYNMRNRVFNDFRDYDKYTNFKLSLPFAGELEIDPVDWYSDDEITLNSLFDGVNGTITYYVDRITNSDSSRKRLGSLSGYCAVDIAINYDNYYEVQSQRTANQLNKETAISQGWYNSVSGAAESVASLFDFGSWKNIGSAFGGIISSGLSLGNAYTTAYNDYAAAEAVNIRKATTNCTFDNNAELIEKSSMYVMITRSVNIAALEPSEYNNIIGRPSFTYIDRLGDLSTDTFFAVEGIHFTAIDGAEICPTEEEKIAIEDILKNGARW